jgi:hypothetical protein
MPIPDYSDVVRILKKVWMCLGGLRGMSKLLIARFPLGTNALSNLIHDNLRVKQNVFKANHQSGNGVPASVHVFIVGIVPFVTTAVVGVRRRIGNSSGYCCRFQKGSHIFRKLFRRSRIDIFSTGME